MRRLSGFALLLLVASPASAQRTELSFLAGYTAAGNIEKTAPTITKLEVAPSFTWGVEAGHFFNTHVGVEGSWARQHSALALTTSSGRADLFGLRAGQLHANFAYQFGKDGDRLRPFVLAGLGFTLFSAPNLDTEMKLSLGLGAGLKWLPAKGVGARLQARYNPTHLNDKSSDYCDPFGFCQGWLQQFELLGGLVFRF